MKNTLLSIALVYGLGMSAYSAWWYERDMKHLNAAVANGDSKVELRHRINVWGDVVSILGGNIISVIALSGIKPKKNNYNKSN